MTQVDLLLLATRFEVPGKAIMRKRRGGGWIVTDGSGTQTSTRKTIEAAFREFCRLSEAGACPACGAPNCATHDTDEDTAAGQARRAGA